MEQFAVAMPIGNTRTARITAVFSKDEPEHGAVEGDPYPLELASRVWFVAKFSPDNEDAQAVMLKATDLAGDDRITFSGSTAYFDIVPADTEDFTGATDDVELYCLLQVLTSDGEAQPVAEGVLTFTV